MSTPMASTPAPIKEELVTFWDITRKQYTKNRLAMVALWLLIITIVLATAAPLICMNAPYIMKSEDGIKFPLFDQIFNLRRTTTTPSTLACWPKSVPRAATRR